MRLSLLFALTIAAAPLAAQTRDSATAGPELSLQDALRLARSNNTDLQQTLETRRTARASQRAAYGSLLPTLDASFGGQYQEGGPQISNGLTLGTNPNTIGSSYALSVNYNLNASSIIAPRVAAATRDAVEADISGATESLASLVTQQYLTVLQASAKADLADTLVAAAQSQVELAKARAAVGSATALDVQRAEVDLATQQVQALQARNQIEIEKLRLFQRMGVDQPANVQLTSAFTITPPTYTIDQLLSLARNENPQVVALRSRESAAQLGIRQAQGEYTPSLNVSTGWGGYTQRFTDEDALIAGARANVANGYESCLANNFSRAGANLPTRPCDNSFTAADEAAIRNANDAYPFNFTKNPWSIRAGISLPIFNGFQRELRVEQAIAARNNSRTQVRARELQLNADVTAAYLTLNTSLKSIALQEQNAARARDELRLTEERYRVGAATFLDVTQARATYERAESDRINAVYDYHKAFAALESAVGRPLR